jgi:hypothetical protein
MNTSKLGPPIARPVARDRPAASSSSCVFIPQFNRPSFPTHRPPVARGQGGIPTVSPPCQPSLPHGAPPPRQPPPITQGAATIIVDNPSTGDAAAGASPTPPSAPPPPSIFSPYSNSSRRHLRLELGLCQRKEE